MNYEATKLPESTIYKKLNNRTEKNNNKMRLKAGRCEVRRNRKYESKGNDSDTEKKP